MGVYISNDSTSDFLTRLVDKEMPDRFRNVVLDILLGNIVVGVEKFTYSPSLVKPSYYCDKGEELTEQSDLQVLTL